MTTLQVAAKNSLTDFDKYAIISHRFQTYIRLVFTMSQQKNIEKANDVEGQIHAISTDVQETTHTQETMHVQETTHAQEMPINEVEQENPDDIVDRLLKQMEQEYAHVQSFNDKSYSALQANQASREQTQNNDEDAPEGYELLDSANGGGLSDSEDEVQGQQGLEKKQMISNPEIQQLMEVGPVPESVFAVPETQLDIDVDKIKRYALEMDICAPDWAKDKQICEERLRELFKIQKK